jgi:hypothetical protein
LVPSSAAFPDDILTRPVMDPISLPPTRNDVVQETMVRSVKVAQETNQGYAVVTYNLTIALKAYSIQALQLQLLIMLGNFHLELAFFWSSGNLTI